MSQRVAGELVLVDWRFNDLAFGTGLALFQILQIYVLTSEWRTLIISKKSLLTH